MTHEHPSDTDFERIARDIAGEMTASERAEWDRALAEDGTLAAARSAALGGWDAAGVADKVDVDAAWGRLRHRLNEPTVVELRPGRSFWRSSGVLVAAATTVLAVAIGGILWTRRPVEPVVASSPVRAETVAAQQSTVDLPDGSRVVLGAASSLRTLGDYGATSRDVELVGEAQFTVTHDATRPFRIRTATSVIEDLGTVFTVRAVPAEPLRVSVTEGSVRLRRSGRPEAAAVVLQPRDIAVLADTGDPVVTRGVEVEHLQAWTQGRHDYRNTPAGEVFSDVERWFDLDIQVTDPVLLARPLNVPFDRRMSADAVLEILGETLEVQFERRGRIVTLVAPTRTGLRVEPTTRVGSGV